MPVVQLPFSKGLGTDLAEGDWLDFLPVNMLAVPKAVLNANGYMRSWPGLVKAADASGTGRGAIFNTVTSTTFRVNGQKLDEISSSGLTAVTDVPGSGNVPLSFSENTTAFAADGKLYFWDGTERTELQNWAEGEKFVNEPDSRWTPDFDGVAGYAIIPGFKPSGGLRVSATVYLDDDTSKQFILGNNDTDSVARLNAFRVFVEAGEFFYKDGASSAVKIADAQIGRNDIFFSFFGELEYPILTIGADIEATAGAELDYFLDGRIEALSIDDVDGGDSRVYEMIITTPFGEDAPTVTTVEDSENGQTASLINVPWVLAEDQTPVTPSAPTDYDLTNIVDVTRNGARYIFCQEGKGTFGVTDLENEQRPDYIAAFYSAESDPDPVHAVDSWRDNVVAFGRHTTQFFRLTGNAEVIYQNVPSLTVQAGILDTSCYCYFLDNFAILGGPEFEPPSIFLISQGQYRELATRRIQKILRDYTLDELRTAVMEPIKFDAHDGILIHLPRHVLYYDQAGSSQGASRWTILKTDVIGDRVYRGIYHIYDETVGEFTAADKRDPILTKFDHSLGSHAGESVEYILQTPMIQSRNARIFDFEVDTVSGRTNEVERIALSGTPDGVTFSMEDWIVYNSPTDFTSRVLKRRLGYVKNNIAYRLRWVTSNATSISDFRVRIEQ